jgi:F-type H+-transporting ATPase subunit delta
MGQNMDAALLKGLQTSLPGRYARALFEVALEQKQARFILEKLKEFDTALMSDAHVRKSLPFFNETDFTTFATDLAIKLDWPAYLTHFYQILHKAQRLSLLRAIIDIFMTCCDHAEGKLSAHVSMPFMPTMSQKKRIQSQVVSIFGKEINYEYESIPSLLGGLVVEIDNIRVDASLKTQLDLLQKNLYETPLKGAA